MNNQPQFKELSKRDESDQIYEYATAESEKYMNNKNLCDFFEDDDEMTQEAYWDYILNNIKQNKRKDTLLLNYVFIEEFDNKVFGYKDVSISKFPFYNPKIPNKEWVVAYIGEMCSFSRLKKLSKYNFKKIGKKIFEDFINYLKNIYINKNILIWLLATENSKVFHLKNGMMSSGENSRFLKQFRNIFKQTIYETFDRKEYGYNYNDELVIGKDEKIGENDLFYIITQ